MDSTKKLYEIYALLEKLTSFTGIMNDIKNKSDILDMVFIKREFKKIELSINYIEKELIKCKNFIYELEKKELEALKKIKLCSEERERLILEKDLSHIEYVYKDYESGVNRFDKKIKEVEKVINKLQKVVTNLLPKKMLYKRKKNKSDEYERRDIQEVKGDGL